jgi:hypothetical protein
MEENSIENMSIGTWRDKKIKITEKSKMYLRQ